MSEPFEVAGFTYRAGKLDAIKQLHVVRRLSPLIGALQGLDLNAAMAMAVTPEEKAVQAEATLALLGPITEAVAAMSDADTEYVLGACLGVVQREQEAGLGWASVWSVQAKKPMYDDIGLVQMMTIVAKVLMQNLGDFTSALPRPVTMAARTTA